MEVGPLTSRESDDPRDITISVRLKKYNNLDLKMASNNGPSSLDPNDAKANSSEDIDDGKTRFCPTF